MFEVELKSKRHHGYVAVVDDSDRELVSQYRWGVAVQANGRAYAYATIGGKSVMMHRLLMDPPNRMVVDHIDNDGLNNRRENLRVCTRAYNKANSRKPVRRVGNGLPRGVSSVVSSSKGVRFTAQITLGGKLKWLGTFDTPDEAGRAYDREMVRYYGEYAVTNEKEGLISSEPDELDGLLFALADLYGGE